MARIEITAPQRRLRRLVLRCGLFLRRVEARRLAARVEADSYRMYCMGYPKAGRVNILEEARRFEKWADERFSENKEALPPTVGSGDGSSPRAV